MTYAIYEDPATHRFTVVPLPSRFIEGDKIVVPSTARWFDTREEARATLSQLLEEDEPQADRAVPDQSPPERLH